MSTYSSSNLPPVLQTAFSEQIAYTPEGEVVPLSANVSRDEAVALYTVIRQIRPSASVEIGFAKGVSTLAILQGLADNEGGHHHVIDPFQKEFGYVGVAMVARAELSSYLTFYETFAEHVLPDLPDLGFAFIDSSHLFDLTIAEFVLVDKRLVVGGVIAFHDTWMPSLQKVLRYILNNRAYRIYRVPMANPDQGTSPSINHLKMRFKRQLAKKLRKSHLGQRYLNSETLRPWSMLNIPNLVFIEKLSEDTREWEFHHSF